MFSYKQKTITKKGAKRRVKTTHRLDMTGLVEATSIANNDLMDDIPTVSLCAKTAAAVTTALVPKPPMLAKPVKSFFGDSVKKSLSDGAVYEDKFDGERLLCVVTDSGSPATFYSRTLNRTSFPYAVALKPGYTNCVFDGERVFLNPVTGALVPVCETGPRANVRQCYRVFDVQYVNGSHMFATPLHERKQLLAACLQVSRDVQLTPYTVCKSLQSLRDAFHRVVSSGGEGLMVKRLDAVYVPAGRDHWFKFKTLHLQEYKDEYDLFAHRALKDKNGRYGVLDCGYYTPDSSRYVHVCNVGSGFSDIVRNRITLLVDPSTGLFRRRTVVSLSADKITGRNHSLRHPSLLAFKFDRTTVDVSRFQPNTGDP